MGAVKKPVVYTYAKCSTCRAAVKWLEAHGIAPGKITVVPNGVDLQAHQPGPQPHVEEHVVGGGDEFVAGAQRLPDGGVEGGRAAWRPVVGVARRSRGGQYWI